jgi:serine/threonine-protein kinase
MELQPDAEVGSYRLIRELGRGGMGAVWLAERIDGKLKRQVALKFPYTGPNQRQLVERLARERDILASLEHPNIARLYDADVTALGQPFLVLEYVDGIPINEYCDQHRLTVRERLVLFLQVLNAVQYAHMHLVIHRDLKPSNILLTKDRVAQLLDFGVAKLISEGEIREPALTQFGGRALTPEYASPEQINGGPITTACDIYALGVVLYELLTGNRPYQVKPGPGLLEAAIANADVVAPSRSTVDLETARKRVLTANQLGRALRGDLDTIVLKALRREPSQRYASADALAQDIGRYLDGEPVTAQVESFTYRAAKFVGRHRFGVAASAAVIAAILVGAGVALWQARQAAIERDRAFAMLSRSEAVTDFMTVMITEAAASNEALTMPMLIQRSEAMLTATNSRDPRQLAVIRDALAAYYLSFSQPARAEALLATALEQTRADPDRDLRASLTCKHAYAKSLLDNSYPAREAIAAAIASIPDEPETIAQCLRDSAYIAQNANDAKGALEAASQAQQAYRRSRRSNPVLEASILVDLGYAYQLNGRSDLADQNFAAALRQFTALGRGEHAEIITLLNNWGLADISAGDIRGAVTRFDAAFALAARHDANGDPPAYLVFNRAVAQERLGRLDDALIGYDNAIALGTKSGRTGTIAVGQVGRARVLLARNDLPGARLAYESVVALTKREASEGPAVLGAFFLKASIALQEGRVNDALDGYTEGLNYLDTRKMAIGATVVALRDRSAVYLRLGKIEAALADAKRAMTIATTLQSGKPYSCMTGFAQLAMSRVFFAQHDLKSAHQWAQQAEDQLSHSLSDDHPDTVAARLMAASTTEEVPKA